MRWKTSTLPLVLDPVLVSTSGAPLLDEAGLRIFKTRLLPRATLVTPNMPETEALMGIMPDSDHAMRNAAQAFALLGVRQCAVQGRPWRRADGARCAGRSGGELTLFVSPRQETRHTHGTGCTLATAIACGLAQMTLPEAVPRPSLCAGRDPHRAGIGRGAWAAQSFDAEGCERSTNGSRTMMVSSRSGLVDSSDTGAPINSSTRRTYLMALAGSWPSCARLGWIPPAFQGFIDRRQPRLFVGVGGQIIELLAVQL